MSTTPDSSCESSNREAAGGPTPRPDLQRTALQELVALSAECAAIEAQIEHSRTTASEVARRHHEHTLADIEKRYQELKADIQQRYDEYLAKIRAQYEADLETLNTTERAKIERVNQESAAIEQEVKKKLQHELWLAESVYEGTRNQLREEAKNAQKDFTARRQRLDELEHQVAGLMQAYGHRWPMDDDADEGRRDDEPAATFDSRFEAAEAELARLAAMRVPRLFIGALPFVLTLLLCFAAAAVAQVFSSLTSLQWKPMVLAAGGMLVVIIVAGAVLWRIARDQVAQAGRQLQGLLASARRCLTREYELSEKARQQRLADAASRRDQDVKDAKARFAPLVSKAAETLHASLRAVQEERERLAPRIEAQREAALAETEAWHRRSLRELEEGHDRELEAARRRNDARTAEIEARYARDRQALEQRWSEGLARIQQPVAEGSAADHRLSRGWDDPAWQTWTPPSRFAPAVRFGELRCDLARITDKVPRTLRLPETFSVPALLAFPRQASLLIHADHGGRIEAIRTLQAAMVRLLTSMPAGRVRFTIIDPVGLGQNFAGFMHLADYDEALVGNRIWTEGEHIEQRLADLTEHMETVIQKYLRNEFETIDDYNAQAGELAEPYRFLVIADFPVNFSDTAVHRLNSIASTGARCGVYTLVARDTRLSLPSGAHLDELESHSINLVREGGRFVWRDEVFRRFPLTLDAPPSEDFLTRILHVVGRCAKESKRVEVPFRTIAPDAGSLWTRTSAADIDVPIGRMGATRLQTFRLGRGVAQHALVAGKTGSGKSTLLHVLVTNLALWYSPDEIEFYLVDFKKGVEFKAYVTHALPHARAIAVESDREFGLSVLQRVDAELGRRGAAFRSAGVPDLPAYREATGRPLPRVLLIIDEFQEFFSEDDKLAQDAGLLLDRLVRQGRAFGIHVLLGSQTIGGTSGLARSTIGQMAVRVALQTSEADSQVILGDGNAAARLLSRPGEAIYNDAGGLVEGNSPFQVAWLPDEEREQYLARVREKAAQAGLRPAPAVVFEGNVLADIAKNEPLARLLASPDRPTAGAAPRVWLGEPVAIKDPTAVTLARQSGANVLIVGQQPEAAMGLMAAAMLSLAAQHAPGAASFCVLDGSPADSPLAEVFAALKAAVPHPVRLVEYRAAAEAVAELAGELHRRQASEATGAPAVYLMIFGLQRFRVLRRQEDSFSFSASADEAKPAPDKQFADLLREGPPLGLHVIAWSDTPAAVERTLDRHSLREFDNRVLFQMSASDSSNLIDSPLANKLGQNRALAYSEEQGVTEKFRPYAVPTREWLEHVRRCLMRPGA